MTNIEYILSLSADQIAETLSFMRPCDTCPAITEECDTDCKARLKSWLNEGTGEQMIKFTIPLTPTTKKTHQRILINPKTKRPFIMPSAAYKKYEAQAIKYIPPNIYIKSPCNIKALFYMPTRRRCDLTNHLESIDDIMVAAGLLEDDNYHIIESHDGSRVLYDKANPRTEVEITFYNIKEQTDEDY